MGEKITAREGYIYVCGDAFVTTIYLGENDTINNYPEITIEEMEQILLQREQENIIEL
jgi:hypothetical protein